MRLISLISIFALLVISAISCSHGNAVMPESPGASIATFQSLPVLVSDYDADGSPSGGWGVLGMFEVHGKVSTSEFNMTSLRNGELYDTLEVVDITNFMKLAPCTNCAKLRSVELNSDGTVTLKISIHHPFAAGDPYKPITGRNRADLSVFNVEGIVAAHPDTETPVVFAGLGETVGHVRLVNADGYTSYLDTPLDSIIPTLATVHPYKLHFRDYTSGNFDPSCPTGFVDILHPTGNLVMAMGCDIDVRDYTFNLDGTDRLDFIYAIGCTYAISAATKSLRFTPEYRIPQHNKKAASEVHVEIVSNNLRDGNTSSDCKLNITILDMNHGVAVGDALDQMHAQSDIASISLEVAGVTSAPIVMTSPTPLSGTPRDPNNPLLYEVTFTNSAAATIGKYTGLVKVLDTYAPGQNSAPLLNGMDGIARVDPLVSPPTGVFNISEFATYAAFTIDVHQNTEPPICDINTIPSNGSVSINHNITLDGSGSSDPDGSVVLYQWDFDYNGTTFNVDASGAVVQTQYPTIGDRTVALKVTDDMTASTICTTPVHVTEIPEIPEDFIPVDNSNFGKNVTIVEDYNGILHAFYSQTGTFASQISNIYWAYSDDHGNTWKGHVKIYETSGTGQWHINYGNYHSQVVCAYASTNQSNPPIIFLSWLEVQWIDSANYYERVRAGEFNISNLNSPVLNYLTVHTAPTQNYFFPGAQIISTSQNKIMMYYMQYQGTGWFVTCYKFAPSFAMLPDAMTPTMTFNSFTNGSLIYVYHSTSPLFAVDSHDNILFTISGRMSGSFSPPPVPPPNYDTNYGSVILRYNNSGDYMTGDNWTAVQHYGRSGSSSYWDNWTQCIRIDENDKVHWVFEYQTDGTGSYGTASGNYYMVYGTGSSTGQWSFTYTDPIHPLMTDSGANTTAEFVYASIDTNSQGEVWITYQDASDVPEIYYTYFDGSWHAPTALTVPPRDSGWYPYMFVTSWDGMYVVFNDAATDGLPWLKAIDTL